MELTGDGAVTGNLILSDDPITTVTVPNSSPIWIDPNYVNGTSWTGGHVATSVPKVVERRIYTNGKIKLEALVLDDGTIHIDPDAFEFILETIGFLRKEEEDID